MQEIKQVNLALIIRRSRGRTCAVLVELQNDCESEDVTNHAAIAMIRYVTMSMVPSSL